MKRSTDTRWSPAEIQQNQKEHYAAMAEHPPDRKASEKFHRPAGIPSRQSDRSAGAAVVAWRCSRILGKKVQDRR